MSSFVFEGAFTRLASLEASDYSSLRVLLVETAPSVTDEFVTDLDETAAANYARKTPTGGTLTQQGQKTTVSGSIPTWSALGTAEVLTHWVLVYNTGSDATSWLVAAAALNHTCDGGDLTISTGGFLIDPTITRALGGSGGTAADITYDDTGNTRVTGADVQAALDATESTFGTVATALGTAAATTTQSNNIDTYLHTVAATATGGAVTLPLTKSLQVYDLDPADNPWTFTLPDLTGASAGVLLNLFVYAKTGGNVALSFVSAGSAQDVVWSGPSPSEVPEEGFIIVRAQGDVGGSGKWNMEWGSNIDGWGLTGHAVTVSSGTHLFSHAFEHITLTGSNVTLTRDLTDAGGGSGMFWLKITNSSGSTRTITWGPTITWVAGSAVSTIANGATVLVMLQTLDSGATATGVNVTGLGGLSAPVALSDLATQADQTIVGNNTGGTAAPIALTASQARTVLGLGGAALLAVGTTAGTVAAGDDSRITGAVPKSTVTAKGDLIVATASGAVTNLAVGTAGQGLVPDTSASGGLAWGSPSSMRNRLLRPTGSIAESIERTNIAASGLSASSGRMYAVAVAIPRQTVVTSITFTSVAASTGLTNHWFGLYDASGNQLRLTADNTTTAWSANDPRTLNLSSTYTTGNSDALYYLVVMQNGSGPATLAQSAAPNPASGVVNIAPVLGGRDSGSSYTNPASAPSTFTLTANIGTCLYAYCS